MQPERDPWCHLTLLHEPWRPSLEDPTYVQCVCYAMRTESFFCACSFRWRGVGRLCSCTFAIGAPPLCLNSHLGKLTQFHIFHWVETAHGAFSAIQRGAPSGGRQKAWFLPARKAGRGAFSTHRARPRPRGATFGRYAYATAGRAGAAPARPHGSTD